MAAEAALTAARWAVPICVCIVLLAVALNFALAAGGGPVKWQRRSPIATASMLAIAFGVYLLIHQRIGVLRLPPSAAAGLAAGGAVLVILGAAVNVMGRIRLGGNWANQVTVYEDQTLVQTGVYGLVRHPLYASLIWMFVGASMVYQNAAALAATLLVFVPAMRYRAAQEEVLLAQQFPEYPDYQRRVGRLFPRPRGGTTL